MGTKQYDSATDLITFSRASGGTALRKVSYGPELVTNGTFDTDTTGWVNGAGSTTTFIQTGGVIQITASGGNARVNTQSAITLEVGKTYTFTAECTQKDAESGSFIHLGITSGVAEIKSSIGLNEPAGVYSHTFVATNSSLFIQLGAKTTTASVSYDNISVKEVTFDQADGTLELFNHPDDVPRIEYDAAGAVKGLLIEEQRANLITYSEDFSNSWTKSNTTVTVGSAVSPAGTTTASSFERGSTSPSYLGKPASKASSSLPFVFSIYAKKSVGSYFAMRIQGSYPGRVDVTFNLDTGAVSLGPNVASGGSGAFSLASATSVDCGNGWFRFILSATTDASSGATSYVSFNSNNVFIDGTDSSADSAGFIWGAQLEQGAFPTSYIPTTGATKSRAADVASIPVSAFGYNQKAGSIYVDGTFLNGDTIVTLGSTAIAADADGAKDYTVTYSADPSATGLVLNQGTYLDVKYYPRRLTDAQLQELTT